MNRAYKKHTANIILHCERLNGLPTKIEHSREMCVLILLFTIMLDIWQKKIKTKVYIIKGKVCVCVCVCQYKAEKSLAELMIES